MPTGQIRFNFITDFEHNLNENSLEELQDISFRIKAAYIQRARQAKQLKSHIGEISLPVIICGDFNDTPVSYVYRTVRKGLKDSFVEAGKGFGKTYEQIFPSFRIDYILHSKDLHAAEFKTIKAGLSDHYPLVSTLILETGEK